MRLRRSLPFVSGLLLGIAGTGVAATMSGSDLFRDVTRGAYYDHAIGSLYDAGIITGYGDGRFGPDDYVTRGQVAVMIERLRVELGVSEAESSSSTSRSRRSSSSSSSSTTSSSSSSSVASNPYGFIRFTLADYPADEDDGTVRISVVRTGGNQGSVKVSYELVDDTAKAGSDYEVVSGDLTMEDGETSATFDVKILDDSSSEGSEKLTLKLSSPTGGATLGTPATATLTIRDNEQGSSGSSASSSAASTSGPTVGFSALEYGVAENGGSLTVTVSRLNGTSGNVTVAYAMSDSTAKSATDYTSANGTLSFSSGESSKTFTVTIIDDSSVDGNKAFKLTLSNATGPVAMGTSSATVTITDNESATFGSGSFRFSKSEFTGYETAGGATITVLRQSGAQGTVAVNYATNGGTATAGNDYTATSGTLTFAPGETSKTFWVPLKVDTEIDSDEAINLLLSGPTNGATLGNVTTALLYLYE